MSSRPLPDFSTKQRELKEKYTEPDGQLPNIDLLMVLEDIIFDSLDAVPTPILLDAEKYSRVNFALDWFDATSIGRTSERQKRPFKRRKHGIVIDTPTKEIIITIRRRDKKTCSHCGSNFGKYVWCQCGRNGRE